jgi:hypothetical protein
MPGVGILAIPFTGGRALAVALTETSGAHTAAPTAASGRRDLMRPGRPMGPTTAPSQRPERWTTTRMRAADHQGRLRRRADDGIRTRDLHLGKGLEGVQQGPTASTAIRPKPPLNRGNVHPRRSRSSADPGRRRVVRYSCVTHRRLQPLGDTATRERLGQQLP